MILPIKDSYEELLKEKRLRMLRKAVKQGTWRDNEGGA
jgi:hypothetical protein